MKNACSKITDWICLVCVCVCVYVFDAYCTDCLVELSRHGIHELCTYLFSFSRLPIIYHRVLCSELSCNSQWYYLYILAYWQQFIVDVPNGLASFIPSALRFVGPDFSIFHSALCNVRSIGSFGNIFQSTTHLKWITLCTMNSYICVRHVSLANFSPVARSILVLLAQMTSFNDFSCIYWNPFSVE